MPNLNNASAPEIKKEKVISPIWLLPTLAVLLGAWLLFKAWSEAGISIDIQFDSAKGITAGETQIFYQGLDIGVVKSVELAPNLEGVIVNAEIKREAETLLTADSQFWLVTPKASITEISGLDALVSGNYIELNPGNGKPSEHFVALSEPPNIIRGKGLNLRLLADNLGSLTIGSGVYFKKIRVGEVQRYQLNQQQQVEFDILIKPQFADLVKQDSRFWNVSGFKADISLDGVQIDSESLASVISGGVSFDSPARSQQAEASQQFTLFDNLKSSQRGTPISISMQQQNGLVAKHSKLLYRGNVVGFINDIEISDDHQQFQANALIEPKYEDLFTENSQLLLLQPDISLNGVKNLSALIGAKQIEVFSADGPLAKNFRLSLEPPAPAGSRVFSLTSDELNGVTKDSPILYKGLNIGKVNAVQVQNKKFQLKAYIHAEYRDLLTQYSRFYQQSPLEIAADFNGISVESSGLSGFIQSPIMLLPGLSDSPATQHNFKLYQNKKAAELSKGKTLKPLKLSLSTDYLGSIAEGVPVLYRRVPVGKVSGYQLQTDGQIVVSLHIDGSYKHLVTDSSRFWHASGIEVKASLEGLSINSESLKALVMGGVSFDNFDELAKESIPTLYRSKQDATRRHLAIELSTNNSEGIYANMPIKYKGQQIGKIDSLRFSEDLKTLYAKADLDFPYYRDFARAGSRYWQESASISLSSVKNLDTLVKGDFINALPGKGKPTLNFPLFQQAPESDQNSLHLWLSSRHFGSLKIGSPVLYKQFQVGKVDDAKLAADGSQILARLSITSEYRHLVRQNSVFWNASGVDLKFGLGGADIRLDSVETLLTGGIAFATPDDKPYASAAQDQDKFELQSTYEEKWLQWSPSIEP